MKRLFGSEREFSLSRQYKRTLESPVQRVRLKETCEIPHTIGLYRRVGEDSVRMCFIGRQMDLTHCWCVRVDTQHIT